MIENFILILIVTSVVSFFFGVVYADKKHRQELIQYYEDLGRINTAWQAHCNAMREHYQNALMSKSEKKKPIESEGKNNDTEEVEVE